MTHPTILHRNHLVVRGKGERPMLFAHGFGCDQRVWRFLTPAFDDDYKVMTFDYVGSGRSDRGSYSQRYQSLDGYCEDVVELLQELNLREVLFVGHSVSCSIGILAAARCPGRIAKLILLSPSPCFLNYPPDYVGGFDESEIRGLLSLVERNPGGWAGAVAPMVVHNPDRADLTEELEESFCSMDPQVAREFAAATFLADNRADLNQALPPALVIQCADDMLAPVEVGQYMHQRLPNSILKILNVSGHCPHLSNPLETAAAIKEYLT